VGVKYKNRVGEKILKRRRRVSPWEKAWGLVHLRTLLTDKGGGGGMGRKGPGEKNGEKGEEELVMTKKRLGTNGRCF